MTRTNHNFARGGFTLIELLVVVGIIVLLVGILTPVAIRAFGSSEQARIKMDLQTIATALEAYKQDHGDYPRVTDYDDTSANEGFRGAYVLTLALIAPYDEADDGANGPGFRTRRIGGDAQGRVYGPYLQADTFILTSDPASPTTGVTTSAPPVMLDRTRMPILYFPAAPRQPDLTKDTNFVGSVKTGTGTRPLYNHEDNTTSPFAGGKALTVTEMRNLLGDANANGRIDGNETPKTTGPFLLWAAGRDGEFGTADDITNFLD